MYGTATRLPPSVKTLYPRAHSRVLFVNHRRSLSVSVSKNLSLPIKSPAFPWKTHCVVKGERFRVSKEGSLQELDDDAPVSVELAPISSETQFDRVIAEAQQLEESVIIVWYW